MNQSHSNQTIPWASSSSSSSSSLLISYVLSNEKALPEPRPRRWPGHRSWGPDPWRDAVQHWCNGHLEVAEHAEMAHGAGLRQGHRGTVPRREKYGATAPAQRRRMPAYSLSRAFRPCLQPLHPRLLHCKLLHPRQNFSIHVVDKTKYTKLFCIVWLSRTFCGMCVFINQIKLINFNHLYCYVTEIGI